jgi:hypothetical protein
MKGSYKNTVMKFILLNILVLFLVSCSQFPFFRQPYEGVAKPNNEKQERFDKHITDWGLKFLDLNKKKQIKLSYASKAYLQGIFDQIQMNNEITLKAKIDPKFYILQDSIPYSFSLPGGVFVFSKGLILKYFKNEDLLAAVLSFEMVKCLNLIYKKQIYIPTGYVTIEKMLKITGVDYVNRHEVRKLAFFTLTRSGYDGSLFLRWLQIRNRNTLDFSHYQQSGEQVIREEYSFKNFLMKQDITSEKIINKNSSRKFYKFIDELKGV